MLRKNDVYGNPVFHGIIQFRFGFR